jgi:hypothetical protein
MIDVAQIEEYLQRLLFPETFKYFDEFQSNRKMVHYTTAENGLNIIRSQEVWMRHSSVMNDFMEMEHGTSCLLEAFASPDGKAFEAWIDGHYPDFMSRIREWFGSGHEAQIRNDTYLTSVALHDESENSYGRLSMWRAYGGKNGVALVVNPTPFMSDNQALGAFSTPVQYLSEEGFSSWFALWATRLMDNEALLLSLPEEDLHGWLITAFRTYILGTKHPGFAEEREWRIYHTPAIDGTEGIHLVPDFKTIRGVPQPIMKIPLKSGLGLEGMAIKDLLHRVIIGPSDHSQVIARAYVDALRIAGFEDPWSMIAVSNIPLRQ